MAVAACVRPRVGCTCTETVITCTGDLQDPTFPRKFRSVLKELKSIVCRGSDERLRVRKMEPWNSVRVTFSIGVEAAERLRALAEAGGEVLARLGILSVQMPNGQVISVRANTPSTPPNVVAPAASSIPPLVPAAASSTQPQAARFPFNSMAQASAIVSREAKVSVNPAPSHYPPPPYPEVRPDPPQPSPLLVNLLQTDQTSSTACSSGSTSRGGLLPTRSSGYPPPVTPGRSVAATQPPPPPYTRPVQSSPPRSRLPVAPHQPSTPIHQQEPSGSPRSSEGASGAQTSSSTSGSSKSVQYLINPLTGVLEPMSSESESDAEGPSIDCSQPLSARSPSPPLVQRPQLQQLPLSIPPQQQQPPLPVKEDEDKAKKLQAAEEELQLQQQQQQQLQQQHLQQQQQPPAAAPPPAPAPTPAPPPVREEVESPEEERPKGEEKIKLRLKLEKSESYNLSYKAEAGSEPRVPPLHISLRGRPAVVSRKEKRLRKDDSSRERERIERERERERERSDREPLSQGTFEGTCQFPSEAEVASILRSMPPGGKLLNTTVTARRKRDKKKIYPRSVPRVEEKLKKGSGSLLKSVVKSAAKEVRIMTAQRSSKPLQHKKPASPVLNNQTVVASVTKAVPELDFKAEVAKFKETSEAPRSGSSGSGSAGGDDSGIESMDALSEKSPNQSTSPLRKEELPKKEKKDVEEVQPIRLTPALYTYSNPERQREETPSPDHTEEERYGGKSLLEQLLIDIPVIPVLSDAERRQNSLRSPEIPSIGKRGRRPSESSSSDPPTPRPNKRKCSENASELIKACMEEGKRDAPLPQGDNVDSSDDDEGKVKDEGDKDRNQLSDEKSSVRNTFSSRRSVRQAEIREQRPVRKGTSVPQKKDEGGGKRRRLSKEK